MALGVAFSEDSSLNSLQGKHLNALGAVVAAGEGALGVLVAALVASLVAFSENSSPDFLQNSKR